MEEISRRVHNLVHGVMTSLKKIKLTLHLILLKLACALLSIFDNGKN